MSTTSTEPRLETARAGEALAASGVLGIAIGIVTIAWSPAVADDQWSYPFSTGVQWAISVVLVVTHLLTAVGVVGIRRLHRGRVSRTAEIWLAVAAAGLVALGVCEALSGAIGGRANDSTAAGIVGALFGISSLVMAVAAIVGGWAVGRAAVLAPYGRWMLLASGVVILVLVTPANIAGDLVPRTLALCVWSLLFVPAGLALRQASAASASQQVG